jgi:toxin ParE1/3/4
MIVQVRFTPSARAQLPSALEYIRGDKPGAARSLRERVETALRRLQVFPESGRRIPEFPELPFREVVIRPYRFFYRVEGQVVWIVAVWHGAQRLKAP